MATHATPRTAMLWLHSVTAQMRLALVAKRQLAIDAVVYVVARLLLVFLQLCSLETGRSVAQAVAWLAHDLIKLRRRTVEENLQAVFPELTVAQRHQLGRDMWEHLILMICEIAHTARRLHDTNWRDYVRLEDKRQIVQYMLGERPLVIVSGHFGNFELGCTMIGLLGFPIYAIARPLDNPFLDRFLRRNREANGQFILNKDGSATQVAVLLESGSKLALLGDQHAGTKGCWVDFLGRPASCHKAVALFTLKSDAPMLVISCTRESGPLQYRVTLEGLADPLELTDEQASVTGLTRWYNQALERAIRRAPEQYWWLHRRWRDQPATSRTARAA
ncbi:MAG: lysophospholipid acyltransferase family protein [Planctomycetota bacterium]